MRVLISYLHRAEKPLGNLRDRTASPYFVPNLFAFDLLPGHGRRRDMCGAIYIASAAFVLGHSRKAESKFEAISAADRAQE
jgi:hypothetical protein